MKNTIIQWNCRGLRAIYDELQLLLNDYDPAVVCLQETYLKEPNNVTFRNYNIFNTFAVGDGRGSGGVAIIINNKCPSSQIHLKTNIQAVAVSVTLHRTISICSIYIPPRSKIVAPGFFSRLERGPGAQFSLGTSLTWWAVSVPTGKS